MAGARRGGRGGEGQPQEAHGTGRQGRGVPHPIREGAGPSQGAPRAAPSPSPDYPLTALVSLEGDTWWDGLQFQPSGGEVVREPRVSVAHLEMAEEDASSLGLAEGMTARVTSPQGTLALPVHIAPPGTLAGHVTIPWGADARVGVLPPSFPLDSNGIPPWTVFSVRVGPEPPL